MQATTPAKTINQRAYNAMMAEAMAAARNRAAARRSIGKSTYVPIGTAQRLHESTAEEIVISGPAGTGKSRAALEKLHKAALQYPGMRGLMVRKTRVSLTETGLVTFEDKVLGRDHPILADGPQRGYRHSYRYPNGSEIVVAGLDRPTRVMSSEYDLIFVQEAIELDLDAWESLVTRLRNGKMPYQQLLADTNPDRPTHWLKQRCDSGATELILSTHEDNPTLWDGSQWTEAGKQYIARLDALTGVRKQRLRYGLWVQAEGAVYDEFDERIHVVDELPSSISRIIIAVDFGYTNPFVAQWWAIDNDGRMYLYREIYRTRRTVADHAVTIQRYIDQDANTIGQVEIVIADHDAEDRATLAAAGIYTQAAEKAITVGIQAVQGRLRTAGDGRPRLFLLRNALIDADPELADAHMPICLQDEIPGYIWSQNGAELPIKQDDHGLDAMRYAVMYLEDFDPDGGVH